MGATIWKIAGRKIDLSRRGMIMGILNVTPDSFSDGGNFLSPEKAIKHGLDMVTQGAAIIDIGGESTRPGAEAVAADEEMDRVLPVIKELRSTTKAILSIDTSKADVALAALQAGASIINDVSGGCGDPEMLPLVARREAAFIVMHMQGNPRTMQRNPKYKDVLKEVADFFRQQYDRAITFGIDPMAIAFDPGIGFGKTLEHNLKLLANVTRLRVFNRPLVVGVSRKAFLGKIMSSSVMKDRLGPTVALTALLHERGANVFRVHDVAANVAALETSEAILGAIR